MSKNPIISKWLAANGFTKSSAGRPMQGYSASTYIGANKVSYRLYITDVDIRKLLGGVSAVYVGSYDKLTLAKEAGHAIMKHKKEVLKLLTKNPTIETVREFLKGRDVAPTTSRRNRGFTVQEKNNRFSLLISDKEFINVFAPGNKVKYITTFSSKEEAEAAGKKILEAKHKLIAEAV